MIADNQTNTVYFSELLKSDSRFTATCNQITDILASFEIRCGFLPKTKDIWARDYMPIQINENKYIEYRYDPDYLQGTKHETREIKTYPDIVCDAINLKTIKSDIILDGGNVVKSKNCVILTDKVIQENKFLCNKTELIKKLEELLEVEHVVIIPSYKDEEYGHSDGMLRFIDEKTVLVNELERCSTLEKRLKEHGLKWEYLCFDNKSKNEYRWAYLNFLQTGQILMLPKFNVEDDDEAFEKIKYFYPYYARNNAIAQVDMTAVVKYDGALNCISWTKKEKQ